MQRIKRLIGFILAFVMALSIPVYGGDQTNTQSDTSGGHSGLGTVTNGTDESSTGYKISLVFLPIDGLDQELSAEERIDKIDAAWEAANPEDATQIGPTIYLTSATDELNVKGEISHGFPFSGFTYGLGTRTGSKSRKGSDGLPDIKKINEETIVTPAIVNSVMDSLNLPSLGNAGSPNKYTAYSMKMSPDLPINIGNKKNGADLRFYFMRDITDLEREADEDIIGSAYSASTFAALVNYLATDGGTEPDKFIYFARIKDNVHNDVLYKHDSLVPEGANCFEQGRYNGNLGEYRLTVEPYWNVKIPALGSKVRAALTLRDFAFLFRLPQQTYKQITIDQEPFYGDLGFTTRLRSNDIWGLTVTDRGEWEHQGTSTITDKVEANKGGGLGFFTSSMMQMKVTGSPSYIGSITNVFLPGALTDDNQQISVASMEYIGPRAKTPDVLDAMNNIASSIVKGASGHDIAAEYNMIADEPLTRDAILNGTIRLPGINPDDINNEAGQAGLIEQLELLIDEYGTDPADGSSVRTTIKDMLRNELGVDVDNPGSGSLNMQDFNLAVYVAARYGMDGMDALSANGDALVANTDADGDGNLENAGYNTPFNRMRQALTLATMMENDKTKETLKPSDGSKWNGPFTITADDIKATLDDDNNFSTHVLDDAKNAQLQGYENTDASAGQAIKDKVLDDVSNGGQISIVNDEYTKGTSEDYAVWKTMLDPPELQKGLLKRVPIAVGNTQVYIAPNDDHYNSIEVFKGIIPTTVGATLQALLKEYVNVCENADMIEHFAGKTLVNSIDFDHWTTPYNSFSGANIYEGILNKTGTYYAKLQDTNNTVSMPITHTTSFDSSYRIGTGELDEDKSIAFNTFGMNELINTSIVGLFAGYTPAVHKIPAGEQWLESDYKWQEKVAALMYSSSYDGINWIASVAPTYAKNKVKAESAELTKEALDNKVDETHDNLTQNALVVNDAIFSNIGMGNDSASLLAASNYYLNQGLASDEATVKTHKKTTLVNDVSGGPELSVRDSTELTGDYGISYVVYDAAIPVDIQFATEVDGKIVPLELASENYDNTLISNVWYAAPNLDKVVQLQKYYTVKDKKGKAHTLEVEEAVVKSATISEKDELKEFYDAYTKAYNENNKGMFQSSSTAKGAYDDDLIPRTKRTVLDKTSANKLNREAYTQSHKDTLDAKFRYLSASDEDLGMPTGIDNLTDTLYNAITITPSIYDKEAYLADPAANRLQVIVKVRALSDLVQYNMIQGLNGDYVEKVTPEIVDGKVNIENSLLTSTGTAERTPYDTDNPANNKNTGTQSSVFMLERDVDPNSERDDWTWEGFKNSKAETGKYRFLDDNNRPTQPEIDDHWTKPPILNLGGDDDTMEDSLDIPGGTRAIYVRYIENPPLYEIYRDKDGHETVRHRDKIVNEDGYIIASKGGTSDNLMNDGTPYYPVMAVAADINFDPPESNTVIDIKETTDTAGNVTTEAKLNEPANWDWVMKNVADYDINISGLSSSANPVKAAKNVTASGESTLFDVQAETECDLCFSMK